MCEIKILARDKQGKVFVATVKAYKPYERICVHRCYFNPTVWRITEEITGMTDGKEYRTKAEALNTLTKDYYDFLIRTVDRGLQTGGFRRIEDIENALQSYKP